MDVRLREHWDALRSSYWFLPTVMSAGAVIGWGALGPLEHSSH
jgi:uncharacterized membrane protein